MALGTTGFGTTESRTTGIGAGKIVLSKMFREGETEKDVSRNGNVFS